MELRIMSLIKRSRGIGASRKCSKPLSTFLPASQTFVTDFETGSGKDYDSPSPTELSTTVLYTGANRCGRRFKKLDCRRHTTNAIPSTSTYDRSQPYPSFPPTTLHQQSPNSNPRQHRRSYVEYTWIHSTVWTKPAWSIYNRTDPFIPITTSRDGTTDRKARKGNLQLSLLVTLLYKEATQMKMVFNQLPVFKIVKEKHDYQFSLN